MTFHSEPHVGPDGLPNREGGGQAADFTVGRASNRGHDPLVEGFEPLARFLGTAFRMVDTQIGRMGAPLGQFHPAFCIGHPSVHFIEFRFGRESPRFEVLRLAISRGQVAVGPVGNVPGVVLDLMVAGSA